MELSHLSAFTHKHCRFKLRSGREVFGVVWEVETCDGSGQPTACLYFASVHDYERLQQEGQPVQVIPMQPDEIVWAESMAS
jgi:hypothetical protein